MPHVYFIDMNLYFLLVFWSNRNDMGLVWQIYNMLNNMGYGIGTRLHIDLRQALLLNNSPFGMISRHYQFGYLLKSSDCFKEIKEHFQVIWDNCELKDHFHTLSKWILLMYYVNALGTKVKKERKKEKDHHWTRQDCCVVNVYSKLTSHIFTTKDCLNSWRSTCLYSKTPTLLTHSIQMPLERPDKLDQVCSFKAGCTRLGLGNCAPLQTFYSNATTIHSNKPCCKKM